MGFLGRNGRIYSDSQRKAMFSKLSDFENSSQRDCDQFSRLMCGSNTKNDFSDVPIGNVVNPVPVSYAGTTVSGGTPSGSAGGFVADITKSFVGGTVSSAGQLALKGSKGVTGGVSGLLEQKFGPATQEEVGGTWRREQLGSAEKALAAVGNLDPITAVSEYGKELVASQPIYQVVSEVGDVGRGVESRTEALASPAIDTAALVAGSVMQSTVDDILDLGGGSPLRTPTNSEWMSIPEDTTALWSMNVDKDYMDVDTIRDLVKKQYPYADVDTKVKFLDPGKYTQFALRENPGREREAMTSNGFYSPVHDTAYLEKDPNKLNTLRAAIHELVHDMSDDGVNDSDSRQKYMLNEGYADYVAKKIMTQELGLSNDTVKKTIGYPEEVKQVEKLVALNGREKVDEAFLVDHSLDGLHLN